MRNILHSQYARYDAFIIGEDINRDIRRFRSMSMEENKQIKLLMGHMSHGLHQFFSAPSTYLTLLRDPVERVFSEYRFLSSNPYHPLYSIVSQLSYHQYLDVDPTRQASNGQTRLLSGNTYGDQVGVPGIEPLGQLDLTRALDHLKRYYPLVGLLERFDESLLLWRKLLNWYYPLYEKKNITQRRLKLLDKSEIEHTKEKNQFDMTLYQQAASYLEANLKQQPHSFHQQLAVFKFLNNAYQKTKRYGRAVKQKIIVRRQTQ